MNDTPIPETDSTAEDALKRRLLHRIAIAAVMVVALLGSLAVFDAIYAPGKPAPVTTAALPPRSETPAAIEPAKEQSVPVPATDDKPGGPAAGPVAETKPESATVAKLEERPVPEGTAAAAAPPLQPLPPEKPLTRPASSRPVSVRPSEPVTPATSPAARPEPARELAESRTAPRPAPASRPISGAGERQFALQMGVFGNVANAEDLRAKLELHGIPASIEARVHVGPFRTRAEADAARAKLKELGLEPGLLVSVRK